MNRRLAFFLTLLLSFVLSTIGLERRAVADGVDTCAQNPPVLDASNASGTTNGKANDVNNIPLACNGIYQQVAGPDSLYSLIVGTGNNFTITVAPQAGYDVSVYLLGTCGNGGTCTRAVDNELAGVPESLAVSGLAVGRYTLGIDSFFPAADSLSHGNFTITLTGTLGAVNTTTTLQSSQNASVFGQSVTFTATVASGAGVPPSGSYVFTIDGVASAPVAIDAAGVATLTTSALSAGAHTVTAAFTGAAPFQTSQATITQNVNKANTTTIVLSPGAVTAGDAATFTVNVNPVAPGAGMPDGNVSLTIDGAAAGGPVALVNGSAAITVSSLNKGNRAIVATYSGSASFNASTSATLDQAVTGAVSTTTVTSSANPAVFGQSVTFTATVTSPASGMPTGTVSFVVDGATAQVVTLSASGAATLTAADLGVGAHTIAATYSGDDIRDGSTGTLTQTVNKSATTTTLNVTPNPAVSFELVTLTATVTTVAPGAGEPTGTVAFSDNGNAIGSGAVGAGGVATLPFAFGAGNHVITATYSGDVSFDGSSSGPTTLVVSKANTTTVLASSSNPSVVGQAVTFTAQIVIAAPGNGAPTGTVTFFDGSAAIGTGTLTGGFASLTTSALTVGAHSITAVYGGDADRNGSTSNVVDEQINSSGAIVALTSSNNPAPRGQPVTFTATVTAVGAPGTPTGSVTFKDNANPLGTVPVNGSAQFTTSTLSGGQHTISAEYSGDGTFNPAAASLFQTISTTGTTTTLTATPNPSVSGTEVELRGTVTGTGAGTPTGQIVFMEGSIASPTFIGNAPLVSGAASFKIKTLSIGVHTIRAVYSGSTDFTRSESLPLTVTVKAKDGPAPEEPDGGVIEPGPTDAGATDDAPVRSDASVGPLPGVDAGSFNGINIGDADGDDCSCRVVGTDADAGRALAGAGLAGLGLLVAISRRRRRRSVTEK